MDVEGKNVLLYGENGSGKSSIYWSIYTFFQSCFKQPNAEGAMKYFQSGNTENLRNKFSTDDEGSGISIEFIDLPNGRILNYCDSDTVCNTHIADDNFVIASAFASDFMNYKYLSAIFDFKNSKKPELFPLFSDDVLPSTIFRTTPEFCHIDGTQPQQAQTADYWWKYLKDVIGTLPKGHNPKYTLRTTDEFVRYNNLRKAFDESMDTYLTLIETKTNQKLHNDFHIEAEIKFDYRKSQIIKEPYPTIENGNVKLIDPRIYVSAFMIHNKIRGGRTEVIHPRSFFNEAKLTCMAIALRLSIAELSYNAVNDGVSALFIDDLLISLDMSTRIPVIDILLKSSQRYQLFIFTHDFQFFNMIKYRISVADKKAEWIWRELYSVKKSDTDEPKPLLLGNEKPYDKAWAYLSRCDYAAAANALRRQCEEELKRILPYNSCHSINSEQCSSTGIVTLSTMICELKKMYQRLGMPYKTTKLNLYRELLMNPLSHNDVRTSVYKNELLEVFPEVDFLMNIKITEKVKPSKCSSEKTYQIRLANGESSIYISFYFKDPWRILLVEGKEYSEKPKIVLVDTNIRELSKGKEYSLISLYSKMCILVYGDDNKDAYPQINDVFVEL